MPDIVPFDECCQNNDSDEHGDQQLSQRIPTFLLCTEAKTAFTLSSLNRAAHFVHMDRAGCVLSKTRASDNQDAKVHS